MASLSRLGLSRIAAAVGLSLLVVAFPDHHAIAQLLNPSGDNLPLQVQADSGIEWQQDQKLYIARGNAVAVRNGKTIKADILTAYMVKTKPADSKAPARPGKASAPQSGTPTPTPVAAPGASPTAESKISRVDAQGHVVVTNAVDNG